MKERQYYFFVLLLDSLQLRGFSIGRKEVDIGIADRRGESKRWLVRKQVRGRCGREQASEIPGFCLFSVWDHTVALYIPICYRWEMDLLLSNFLTAWYSGHRLIFVYGNYIIIKMITWDLTIYYGKCVSVGNP